MGATLGVRMAYYLYKGYLNGDEEIQFVIHRHLFLQVKHFLVIFLFGIALPSFAWWLFPEIMLFAVVWLAIGVARFLYEFFDWYYDVWLVTNQSIVEIMWKGFFDKSSARIEYHTIQGIGYEVNGLLRTIFNFGDIALEKYAGSTSVFAGAVSPKRKTERLTKAQEKFVTNKNFRDHRALQSILTDLLQQHVVQQGVLDEEE